MTSGQSLQVQLTGLLPFIVLLAVILAFPLSLLLLRLYRRSVVRGMAAHQAQAAMAPEAEPSRRAPPAALQIHKLTAASAVALENLDLPAYRLASSGLWRSALAYAIGGIAYAVVMTAAWLAATRDANLVWTKLLLLFWTYYWPAVLAVLLVAAYDRTRRLQIFGAYFAVLALLMAVAIARNPTLGVGQLPLHWIITNAPASILLLAFLARPIRAVGPIVLVFLIVVATGSQTLLALAARDENILRGIAKAGFALGLGGTGVFVAMIVVGMLLFGLLGWPLLLWLGRRYEQKKFSDQSLAVDSIWLVFGLIESIGLVFEAAAWILTGLVAFAAYKITLVSAQRLLSRGGPPSSPRTLLLLRVFALGKRSEQLFDKLRKHWQPLGSMVMIAGPDLATATVEPHEFLEFVSGRQASRFVTGPQALQRRLDDTDWKRDPDGRYRVNEFFCQNDTWQMTVEQLAGRSDAVLMDLRSFTPSNQGCIFELGRLVDGVDLSRVVFLVDGTTDAAFMQDTLQRLWTNVASDSPNVGAQTATARVLNISRQSERELGALLRLLLGATPAAA